MLNQEIDPEKHMKYAQIHRDILNAPKFGNDDDYVDDIFVKVWQDYDRVTGSETTYNATGGSPLLCPSPLTDLTAA